MLIAAAPDSGRVFPVAEADLEMRAIAEGLVGGSAAAAERHAVANFVREAVGGDHRYPTAHPQRPADALRRILGHADGFRQLRLERRVTAAFEGHEPAGGAVADLANEIGAHLRVLGALHLVPHLAVRIAEARPGTERLGVRQRVRRPLEHLSLLEIRCAARGFRAIEADLLVGTVAEGLGGGVPAATERVGVLRREGLALDPFLGAALAIRANGLPAERYGPRDEVRPVLRYHHLRLSDRVRHVAPPAVRRR